MPSRRLIRPLLLAGMLLALGGQSHPPAADEPPPPGAHLPRPVSTYRDRTASGLPVRIDYYADLGSPFLAFRIDEAPSASKPAPTLEEEGGLLDRLLGRLLAEHADLPPTFAFATDTIALVAALDQRLLAPDANWDSRRGTSHRGAPGAALTAALAEVLAHSPIAAAFAAHSYRLSLAGISHIEMPERHSHGPRVPAHILEIAMTATAASADPLR